MGTSRSNEHPKVFISYSWSSSERATKLAELLARNGVEVLFDKWVLRAGHDIIAFMERCVSDPDVKKVLILCDKAYAEKADKRVAGVGDETEIITPEVYGKTEQEKFIPVIIEVDIDGKPYRPAYLKSRKYIDLSKDGDLFDTNFEELLRDIYDKPLIKKPPIGPPPVWLDGDNDNPPSQNTDILGSLIRLGDYEWRIINVQDHKMLVLSDKIIMRRAYRDSYTRITWEKCELRSYLNYVFYNSLGQDKSRIMETPIENNNNPWYGTRGGNPTKDKVFLLSLHELVQYFGDSGALDQKKSSGIRYYYYDSSEIRSVQIEHSDKTKWCWFSDQYDSKRIAYDTDGKSSWWWLRSPGDSGGGAARVDVGGAVHVYGGGVSSGSGGVRPALWLNR